MVQRGETYSVWGRGGLVLALGSGRTRSWPSAPGLRASEAPAVSVSVGFLLSRTKGWAPGGQRGLGLFSVGREKAQAAQNWGRRVPLCPPCSGVADFLGQAGR